VLRDCPSTKIYTTRDTSEIDALVRVDVGTYSLTFVARSSSRERVENTVSVTVELSAGNCEAPSQNVIVVCKPAANAVVASPVRILALAKTGNTWRFELWDMNTGSKLLTVRNSGYMSGSVPMGIGQHWLRFIARREDGYTVAADKPQPTVPRTLEHHKCIACEQSPGSGVPRLCLINPQILWIFGQGEEFLGN
jgi:hypothetical protein